MFILKGPGLLLLKKHCDLIGVKVLYNWASTSHCVWDHLLKTLSILKKKKEKKRMLNLFIFSYAIVIKFFDRNNFWDKGLIVSHSSRCSGKVKVSKVWSSWPQCPQPESREAADAAATQRFIHVFSPGPQPGHTPLRVSQGNLLYACPGVFQVILDSVRYYPSQIWVSIQHPNTWLVL